MDIHVDFRDVPLGVKALERFASDQVPFAQSLTINRLALRFQKEQRQHQRTVFTVRRKTFVDRAVKLKPKATKRRPEATVAIDPPGGQARADILTKFEDENVKRPQASGGTLAVPSDGVRRGKTGVITKASRIASFNLRPVSKRVSKGDRGVFLIRTGPRRGFIFRRKGRRGAKILELLYTLVPEVPIDPELDFLENAQEVVSIHAAREYGRALAYALRTAK